MCVLMNFWLSLVCFFHETDPWFIQLLTSQIAGDHQTAREVTSFTAGSDLPLPAGPPVCTTPQVPRCNGSCSLRLCAGSAGRLRSCWEAPVPPMVVSAADGDPTTELSQRCSHLRWWSQVTTCDKHQALIIWPLIGHRFFSWGKRLGLHDSRGFQGVDPRLADQILKWIFSIPMVAEG